MIGVLARWALLTGPALGLVVLLAGPANAHAQLVDTDPEDGQVLAESPERITLRFDEPVTEPGGRLIDADGDRIPVDVTSGGRVVTVTTAATLPEGSYALSWRVVSADGHPVTGDLGFWVGERSGQLPDVPLPRAERERTVLVAVVETGRYGGILLLAGLAVFGSTATPVTRRDEGARRRLLRTTDLAGAAAGLGALLLLPWTDPVSSAGAAGAMVLVAVPVVLVALRSSAPVLACASSGLTLASLVAIGHTRSYGPAWLVLPADLAHVTAAAVWAGGVVGLLVLFSRRLRARDAAQVVARFSRIAVWSLALLLLAAVLLYWRIAGSIEGLWLSGYGWIALAKATATMAIVALGAWNRYRLVPRVERSASATRTLHRILSVEAGLLALVIVLTGVLVGTEPPGPVS